MQNKDYEELEATFEDLQTMNSKLKEQLEETGQKLQESESRELELMNTYEERIEEMRTKLNKMEANLQEKEETVRELIRRQTAKYQQENNELKQETGSLEHQKYSATMDLKFRDTLKEQELHIENLTLHNNELLDVAKSQKDEIDELRTENLQVSEKILWLNAQTDQMKRNFMDTQQQLQNEIEQLKSSLDQAHESEGSLKSEIQHLQRLLAENTEQQKYKNLLNRTSIECGLDRTLQSEKCAVEDRNSELAKCLNYYGITSANLNQELLRIPVNTDQDKDQQIAQLQQRVREDQAKQNLLAEAYEQLEHDTENEIEKAVKLQNGKLIDLEAKIKGLELELQESSTAYRNLEQVLESLEEESKELRERNMKYEQGISGLPEALEEIKQLKISLIESEKNREELVSDLNNLSERLEDLDEDNSILRSQLGLSSNNHPELQKTRIQRKLTMSQLKTLNRQLESEICDLEHERVTLKQEIRLRSKFFGKQAMELGLTESQLMQTQRFIEELRSVDQSSSSTLEMNIIRHLSEKVEQLESRLQSNRLILVQPENSNETQQIQLLTNLDSSSIAEFSISSDSKEKLLRSQIRSLAKEIAELEQELNVQKKENQLLTAVKELTNSSCQTNELVSEDNSVDVLLRKLTFLQQTCNDLRKKVQEIEELKNRNETDYRAKLEAFENERQELQDQIFNLQNDSIAQNAQIKELELGIQRITVGTNEELKQDHEKLVRSMAVIQMKYQRQNQMLKLCQSSERRLEEHNKRQKVQIQSSLNTELMQNCILKYSNQQLQTKLIEALHKIDHSVPITDYLHFLEERDALAMKSERELDKLTLENRNLQSELLVLRKDVAYWTEKYSKSHECTKTRGDERKQIIMMESELKSKNLQRQLDIQERHKQNLELCIKNSEEHIKTLETQLINALDASNESKQEVIRLQKLHEEEENNIMKLSLQGVHDQLKSVSQQIQELKDSIPDQNSNEAQLKIGLEMSQAVIFDQREQIRKLSAQDEETYNKVSLLEELHHLHEKTLFFQEAYDRILTENKALQHRIVALNENTSKHQQLTHYNSSNREFRATALEDKGVSSWRETMLRQTVEDLRAENVDLLDRLRHLFELKNTKIGINDSVQKTSLQQELESSKDEVLFLRKQYQRAKQAVKQIEIDSLSSQERLMNQLMEARTAMTNLNTEVDELKHAQLESENKTFFCCLHDLIHRQEAPVSDSEHHLMLKQIDIVKELRLEMEDIKHHCCEVEHELEITRERALLLQDELDRRDHIEHSLYGKPSSESGDVMDMFLEEMKLQMKLKDSKIKELLKAINVPHQSSQEQCNVNTMSNLHSPLHQEEMECRSHGPKASISTLREVLVTQEREIISLTEKLKESQNQIESLTNAQQQWTHERDSQIVNPSHPVTKSLLEAQKTVEQYRQKILMKDQKLKQMKDAVGMLEARLSNAMKRTTIECSKPSVEKLLRQEIYRQKQKTELIKKQLEKSEQEAKDKDAKLEKGKRSLELEQTTVAKLRQLLVQKAANKPKPKQEDEKIEQELLQRHQQEINDLKKQHWEEQKRLQRRVETLKLGSGFNNLKFGSRTTVNKKSQELMKQKSQAVELNRLVESMKSELTTLQNKITQKDQQLEKSKTELESAPNPQAVLKTLEKLQEVEKERDEFQMKIDTSNYVKPLVQEPIFDGDWEAQYWKKEEELFESRLRKLQVEAQLNRIMQSLRDIYGQDFDQTKGSKKIPKKSTSLTQTREEELLNTIELLKRTLKRKTTATITLTKYKQVLDQKNKLQDQQDQLILEKDSLQGEYLRLQRHMQSIDEDRNQLKAKMNRNDTYQSEQDEAKELLIQQNNEIKRLRKALQILENQVKITNKFNLNEKSENEEIKNQIGSHKEASKLEKLVKELEIENGKLKSELDAFDPAFFEEIEDLKHDHYLLTQKVSQYEEIIAQMETHIS
eukprot:g1216.t1